MDNSEITKQALLQVAEVLEQIQCVLKNMENRLEKLEYKVLMLEQNTR